MKKVRVQAFVSPDTKKAILKQSEDNERSESFVAGKVLDGYFNKEVGDRVFSDMVCFGVGASKVTEKGVEYVDPFGKEVRDVIERFEKKEDGKETK